ncbi:hypothetical protein [uncultured Croceitalea sp.]|uniref:hypothetical protein n=1 Tax=uncultured Croceitalea sp. TaxID=1798908 RepID=UPI0033063830
MARLTAHQVNELAGHFLAVAQAIGDYRYQNFDTLTKAQNRRLRESHKRVLDYSDAMYTRSAILVMENTQSALTQVAELAEQIMGSYTALQNVHKAIDIASSTVTLGASIFSKNPQAILNSIEKLRQTIKA